VAESGTIPATVIQFGEEKTMAVKPIPDGYHTVTPYLTVADAEAQIDFLKGAFGAQETYRHSDDKGHVGHAEMRLGDSMIMLGQAREQCTPRQATFYLYVEDVDAVYKRAVAAGGKSLREPTNEAYGDRSSGVEDSQGNQWWIGTHVEDVSPEEIQRRYQKQAETARAEKSK
jgi:PhnB protein